MSRKIFSTLSCAVLLAATLTGVTTAQAAEETALPSLIRIVVPAAPGSSTDTLGRAVAHQLSSRLGSNVIVENKPGVSTMLGSAMVAKGPTDGSMLLINSTSLVSTAATMADPLLDVVNDLRPVALLEENPLVVATSLKSDIKTPAELVTAARKDMVTHGTVGVGSIAHFAQVLFSHAAGIEMMHVPYKGTALAVTDMAGGNIDSVIATWTTVAPAINSGHARAIAVTSAEPNPAFPDLPTLNSVAPGFSLSLWIGFFAPSGTPDAIVERLNREINAVSESEALRSIFENDGGVPLQMTPAEISQRVRNDFDMFKKASTGKEFSTR